MDYPALTEEEKRKLIAQTPYLQHIIAKYGENAADDQRIVNEWAEEQWHRETGEPASTKITGQILAIIDEKVANYYATRHEIPTLTEALKALAKETKKPYALLKTNYEAGDQLTVGRVNDILGIKATSREIHKTEQPTNATSCETEAKQNTPTPEPTTKHSTNATSCERKREGRQATTRRTTNDPRRAYEAEQGPQTFPGRWHATQRKNDQRNAKR